MGFLQQGRTRPERSVSSRCTSSLVPDLVLGGSRQRPGRPHFRSTEEIQVPILLREGMTNLLDPEPAEEKGPSASLPSRASAREALTSVV